MYVFDNVIDMDFSSMYPHIIISFNIERHTMICKIIIPDVTEDRYDHIFNDEDIIDVEYSEDDSEEEKEIELGYDSGKDFLDNYLTKDTLSMGTKWFNLPDVNEVHNQFKKRFNVKPKKRINLTNIISYIADGLNINITKD